MLTYEDIEFFNFLVKMTEEEEEMEEEYIEELESFFEMPYAEIMALVDEMGLNDPRELKDKVSDTFDNMVDDYGDIIGAGIFTLGMMGLSRMTTHLEEIGVDLNQERAEEAFRELAEEQGFQASEQTMERIEGDIQSIIDEAVSEGKTPEELKEELTNKFDKIQEHEAERIARTELHSANELAKFQAEIEAGVEFHQWITEGDEKVRGNRPTDLADHVSLHGQIVRVGDEFSNGLKFPGDKSGAIEEIISCRCELVPFIMPEGKSAPAGQRYFYEDDLIDIRRN